MTRLIFDEAGHHYYETGVSKGVLYPTITADGKYSGGVAWNGLTSVTESPSGAEETPLYAGNSKYLSLYSLEEFGGTIEAYTYPDEFAECDGSATVTKGVRVGQQRRKPFGLSYRTEIGNDTDGQTHAYVIHLVYGATASVSQRQYQTINNSPEATTMSWEFKTTPVKLTGYNDTSLMVIDSREVSTDKMRKLEDVLYGTDELEPRLPLPSEVVEILNGK